MSQITTFITKKQYHLWRKLHFLFSLNQLWPKLHSKFCGRNLETRESPNLGKYPIQQQIFSAIRICNCCKLSFTWSAPRSLFRLCVSCWRAWQLFSSTLQSRNVSVKTGLVFGYVQRPVTHKSMTQGELSRMFYVLHFYHVHRATFLCSFL